MMIRGVARNGDHLDLVQTMTKTVDAKGRATTTIVCLDVTELLAKHRDLATAHKVLRQFAHELRSKYACASHELEAVRSCLSHQRPTNLNNRDDHDQRQNNTEHLQQPCSCFDEKREKESSEEEKENNALLRTQCSSCSSSNTAPEEEEEEGTLLLKAGVTYESLTSAITLLHEGHQLIETRLQLHKVYRGVYETQPNVQVVDQATLLKSRVAVAKALSSSSTVLYEIATAPHLAHATVRLDCYVFAHIADNLLSNARKHTTSGTVSLSFLGPSDDDKDNDKDKATTTT